MTPLDTATLEEKTKSLTRLINRMLERFSNIEEALSIEQYEHAHILALKGVLAHTASYRRILEEFKKELGVEFND